MVAGAWPGVTENGSVTRRRVLAAGIVVLVLAAGVGAWLWYRAAHAERIPPQYKALVIKAAATCPGLSPSVLAAQLKQESGWRAAAVSRAGAEGIAQFMPHTWRAYGYDANGDGVANVLDPADAIPSAARYDCRLMREVASVPGDPVSNMLAAYNAGASVVRRYGGVPPYPETRQYVHAILARAARPPYSTITQA